jgi:enoyl-CoA hydratase/carnithine racemase
MSAVGIDQILTSSDNGVLRLTINRPEKKNALTLAMYEAMSDCLEQADRDDSIRVVLIHGEGGNFTAGNDLNDFLQNRPTDESAPVFRFMYAVSRLTKPIVAAVDGVAVGIGTTMLLHCDLVYADTNAKFLMPFVNLGLNPEAGSSYLLPLLAGYHRAAELLMLSEPFTAIKALQIGLVNHIVTESSVLEHALMQACKLASKPPASLLLSKRLLKDSRAEIVQRTISKEALILIERLNSPEAKAALEAILNRR